ncbi:hypothetical protein EYF80_055305 [Liparis tanakae]|uniref:Uncharacterized protein n=1 Tax=Liparis tanakae TaxID=230148 RepID=A0A4Z2EZZ9_9TELE|nr:hypothetical protein EYF80_055305 [Liparis tanakae]
MRFVRLHVNAARQRPKAPKVSDLCGDDSDLNLDDTSQNLQPAATSGSTTFTVNEHGSRVTLLFSAVIASGGKGRQQRDDR